MEFKGIYLSVTERMRIFLVSFLILLTGYSFAQNPARSNFRDDKAESRIVQIKIARLTADMKLSKAQAEKFWPVYNDFDKKRIDLNREIKQLSQSITEDDNPFQKQEKIQKLKQQRLDLVKTYKPDFLKIISENQYSIMITSEERFNQILLEKLKERNQDE